MIARAARLRSASYGWAVVVGAAMFLIVGTLMAEELATGGVATGGHLLGVMTAGLICALFYIVVQMAPGASSWILWWLAALPVRWLGWLLHRARPLHAFRWAALVFFLVGFHFDLLAS